MSRVGQVIRSKNRIEKEIREKKMRELSNIKQSTSFNSKMMDLLKRVDIILEDSDVDAVVIDIQKESLADFSSMLINSSELAGYRISQVEQSATKFKIERKLISL